MQDIIVRGRTLAHHREVAPMKIAIGDESSRLLNLSCRIFDQLYHQGSTFSTVADLAKGIQEKAYDIVLVDWKMVQADNYQLLMWAQTLSEYTPIFLIHENKLGALDIVRGLEAGADGHIRISDPEEVVIAKLNAAYRDTHFRSDQQRQSGNQYKGYSFDRITETITKDGSVLALTRKEARLAIVLFENLDRPLSREFLYSQVWGGEHCAASRTVDLHIAKIRIKLGLDGSTGLGIRTLHKFGYSMVSGK